MQDIDEEYQKSLTETTDRFAKGDSDRARRNSKFKEQQRLKQEELAQREVDELQTLQQQQKEDLRRLQDRLLALQDEDADMKEKVELAARARAAQLEADQVLSPAPSQWAEALVKDAGRC